MLTWGGSASIHESLSDGRESVGGGGKDRREKTWEGSERREGERRYINVRGEEAREREWLG